MKGLHCNIYKAKGSDCSNGGISHAADCVTLLGVIHGEGPLVLCGTIFTPDEKAPAVVIRERRELRGCVGFNRPIFTAYPCNSEGVPEDGMFGGSYISTSDSRFPFDCPIALHDRRE